MGYSGLAHDTCFDLLDVNEVPMAEVERIGKVPPEAFRRIAEAFEALDRP